MSQMVESVGMVIEPDGMVVFQDVSEGVFGLAEAFGWNPPKIQAKQIRPRYLVTKAKRVPMTGEELSRAETEDLWALHDAALNGDITSEGMVSLMDLKLALSERMMESCHLCEWKCGANRLEGEIGICGSGRVSRITRAFVNYGEEARIIPSYSVFLSGCNWSCPYCQYPYELDAGNGSPVEPDSMAEVIEESAARGAGTVQFLGGNPDQHIPAVLDILSRCEAGVEVVWNSNGYASLEAMKLLEGIVDIYLTDFRYGNDICTSRYGAGPGTWEAVTRNLLLAADQGEVIVRHLQLPGHFQCCTRPCFLWMAENLRRENFDLNLMNGQYFPAHRAYLYPEINRRLTSEEKDEAYGLARELDLPLVG